LKIKKGVSLRSLEEVVDGEKSGARVVKML